jgi:exopolysaccharide production protein ExoY
MLVGTQIAPQLEMDPNWDMTNKILAQPSIRHGALAFPQAPTDAGCALAGQGVSVSAVFPKWKRGFDVLIASLTLVFVAPLLAFVAVLIVLDGGPVFFTQARVGARGKVFRIYKFRTMFADAGVRLNALLAQNVEARSEWDASRKLRHDPRITAVGKFLRKSSLDELPQLINVLRGEMSIVGPRPIVQEEVPRYGRYFRYYMLVRPGITGLWQVSGRNDVSYRRRVALDAIYSRKTGDIRMELKILAMTLPAVLFSKGSY